MPYLIDGHNLIGRLDGVSLGDPRDEDKLIARLASFARLGNKRVTVVFDPAPHEVIGRLNTREQRGGIMVIWAPAGRSADDVLREEITATKDRKGLIVVSSDAAVAGFARVSGVRALSSSDFARQLRGNREELAPEKPAEVGNVDEWLGVFKEPPAREKPIQPPRPSPEAAKRQRRMEQLKKQAQAKKPLF